MTILDESLLSNSNLQCKHIFNAMEVKFNKLTFVGEEQERIAQAMDGGPLQGGGRFLKACESILREKTNARTALLTTSCTSALDMAAIVCNIEAGDEVIVPSYTFVSSVNAFVLRGAKPVFCDVKPETLNIDETKIEELISARTKVIVVVHYAGVACDMDKIMSIARKYNLLVVEDAAQAFNAFYKGVHLGTIGHVGALSFHSTKNVIAGEGGAFLTNDDELGLRANYVREKGTNRVDFINGKIDKYSWVDIGSSYIPSELTTAFLSAQLENADALTLPRVQAWKRYRDLLSPLESDGKIKLCKMPEYAQGNGHIFYIYFDDASQTNVLREFLKSRGIEVMSHYAPLHTSPMGKTFAPDVCLPVAEKMASAMLRLPMYATISEDEQNFVCENIKSFFD